MDSHTCLNSNYVNGAGGNPVIAEDGVAASGSTVTGVSQHDTNYGRVDTRNINHDSVGDVHIDSSSDEIGSSSIRPTEVSLECIQRYPSCEIISKLIKPCVVLLFCKYKVFPGTSLLIL